MAAAAGLGGMEGFVGWLGVAPPWAQNFKRKVKTCKEKVGGLLNIRKPVVLLNVFSVLVWTESGYV